MNRQRNGVGWAVWNEIWRHTPLGIVINAVFQPTGGRQEGAHVEPVLLGSITGLRADGTRPSSEAAALAALSTARRGYMAKT